MTSHHVGIRDLLDSSTCWTGGYEVTLYAITIDPHQPITLDLLPEIREAGKITVNSILAELPQPLHWQPDTQAAARNSSASA